jgi:integrase
MVTSTRIRKLKKPKKPHPDFPLFPHATKRWAKKIRGKTCYFGPWDDPDGALQRYTQQKDDLLAGRKPRIAGAGELTVRDLCNRFQTRKRQLVDSGEIRVQTWADYHSTCERILAAFGKERPVPDLASDDFESLRAAIATKWGPVALGNEIQRVRSVFKFAFDEGLIDRPVRYGQAFKRPAKKVLRKARAERGPRMFQAAELREILRAANVNMKAMVLLGVNAGLGNTDCGSVPIAAFDLKRGWLDFPRPKTGVPRRCKLWPETVEAVRRAIAKRPAPKDTAHDGLVFLTQTGRLYLTDSHDNHISLAMKTLLEKVGLHRPGLGFYALRHTFETIAGGSRDQVAVDRVMGHADDSMANAYREFIEDERLESVANVVRRWLFGK